MKPTFKDHIIQNSDLLTHYAIRIERPVYNAPITIIFEDNELVVVDKPPSLPVHPTGAYNRNTLKMILEAELGYKNIKREIISGS